MSEGEKKLPMIFHLFVLLQEIFLKWCILKEDAKKYDKYIIRLRPNREM